MNQKPVDEGKQDQKGNKSSKRVWAYRFGWMGLGQLTLLSVVTVVFVFLDKDIKPGVAEVMIFSASLSVGSCLIALGLTLPEWFAMREKKE